MLTNTAKLSLFPSQTSRFMKPNLTHKNQASTFVKLPTGFRGILHWNCERNFLMNPFSASLDHSIDNKFDIDIYVFSKKWQGSRLNY